MFFCDTNLKFKVQIDIHGTFLIVQSLLKSHQWSKSKFTFKNYRNLYINAYDTFIYENKNLKFGAVIDMLIAFRMLQRFLK